MKGHQYALDVRGRWVDAKKMKYQKHVKFFCDCPDRHPMKLVKPSGSLGKRGFCDYFAHNVKKSKTHHDPLDFPTCKLGGESYLHRSAKHVLRVMVGQYRFADFQCVCCGGEEYVETDDCSVTMEVRSNDKKWRYDCLLRRGEVDVAALEVVHTHLIGSGKADAVRASGLKIAEFRAEDVMKMMARGDSEGGTLLDNLQVRLGKCYECLLGMSIRWQKECFVDELNEAVRQEEGMVSNYMHIERLRRLDDLNRILAMDHVVKKCKLLLQMGLKLGVRIHVREVGTITCSRITEWEHGLLASGFNVVIPTQQICIVILQDSVDVLSLRLRWNYNSIKRRFYFFINCATILKLLGGIEVGGLCLLDCRPLAQYERHMGRRQRPDRRVGTCDSWYDGVFAEKINM